MASGSRRQRKKKQRQERLRQEKHRRRLWSSMPLDEEAPPRLGPELEMLSSPSGRAGMERDLRRLHKELRKRDFKTEEEFEAFMAKLEGRRIDEVLGLDDDPVEEAHELAEKAFLTESAQEAELLSKRALELDPHCIDAMSVQAMLRSKSPDELIASMREVVRAAREALGDAFFETHHGHFWSLIESRPFMRARAILAEKLAGDRRDEEAIAEYAAILELNPNDNQGVRFPLLGLYLANDRLGDARRLIAAHRDKGAAVMAWGTVLERYLAGNKKQALRALEHARTRNPYVEPYLAGRRPLPDRASRHYTLGSPDEAACCASELGRAWKLHPTAVDWLRAQAT